MYLPMGGVIGAGMSRATMRAMVLARTGSLAEGGNPPFLELRRLPVPEPGPREVLVRVHACGVCHTDLDQAEGRITPPRLPVVPGHQAVGRVAALGSGVGLEDRLAHRGRQR